MWTLAGVGAALAGLFLMFRSLLPWLEARRSGVIRTQGLRPQRVEREVEPERFEALCRGRLGGVWPGAAMFLGGGLFALMQVVAIASVSAQ